MYKQSSHFTNLATSLMFILKHFNKKFELSKENEYNIWLRTVNLPLKASSVYGIALFAKEKGLKVKMFVGEKGFSFPNYRFKGYKKIEIEEAEYVAELYRKRALSTGVEIIKKDFDLKFVKKLLKEKKVVLLRINMGVLKNVRAVSQYITVFDYKNKIFTILDPSEGKKQKIPENVLKQAFETLGEKCHRDNRMVVFE